MQTADVQKKAARRAPQRSGFKKIFEWGGREQFVNQSKESVQWWMNPWTYFPHSWRWSKKKKKNLIAYCISAPHKDIISIWRRHITAKRSLFTSRKQNNHYSWQLNQYSECLPELHPYGPIICVTSCSMTLSSWKRRVLILWKTCI